MVAVVREEVEKRISTAAESGGIHRPTEEASSKNLSIVEARRAAANVLAGGSDGTNRPPRESDSGVAQRPFTSAVREAAAVALAELRDELDAASSSIEVTVSAQAYVLDDVGRMLSPQLSVGTNRWDCACASMPHSTPHEEIAPLLKVVVAVECPPLQ